MFLPVAAAEEAKKTLEANKKAAAEDAKKVAALAKEQVCSFLLVLVGFGWFWLVLVGCLVVCLLVCC